MVELVLEEVAAEFGGEDPALPDERQALDEIKEKVEDLHRHAQTYTGSFKLPEPEEKLLNMVWEVVRREKGRYERGLCSSQRPNTMRHRVREDNAGD